MKLKTAIRQFVEWKHFCGRSFVSGEQILTMFLRSVGNMELNEISKRNSLEFLYGIHRRAETYRRKYLSLHQFFRYWLNRGQLRRLPLPRPKATRRLSSLPFVYGRSQIRLLLAATHENQKSYNCVIDANTFRAFILFLYGTGACVGEALKLRRQDVDFPNNVISFQRTTRANQRTLPLANHVRKTLLEYGKSMPESCRNSEAFFVDKLGRPLKPITVGKMFQKLRRRAGVRRTDSFDVKPRLHDLRHTFAVHSLSAWLRQGKDLRVLLPALSAYLGQAKLNASEKYLRILPERFRPQLSALLGSRNPNKGVTHKMIFPKSVATNLSMFVWQTGKSK
jgi:integrase/recombinase XerD